jgi:ATP-dependent helicase/nuclease subunit A
VLDYKSAAEPLDRPELLDQLASYRRAVAALYPGKAVHAAFLTPQGRLIELA